MKYFPTKHARLEEQGFKCKQGQVVDLKEDDAAVFNALIPGLLIPFDPAVHQPPVQMEGGIWYNPATQRYLTKDEVTDLKLENKAE